jgi:hypothetical protein
VEVLVIKPQSQSYDIPTLLPKNLGYLPMDATVRKNLVVGDPLDGRDLRNIVHRYQQSPMGQSGYDARPSSYSGRSLPEVLG